jgi:ketosteroid isomerase-like protein
MQTQQQIPTQPESPKPKRPGWIVAAAALALILIVGAVVLFSNSSTEDPAPADDATPTTAATEAVDAVVEPTFTSEEALAVSASYYEAINDGAVEQALALFTSDAVLTDSYTSGNRTPADEEMQYVWNEAQGMKLDSGECTVDQGETEATLTVTCQSQNRNAIAQATGATPVPVRITMVMSRDGIIELHEGYGSPDHNVTQQPFDAWMELNNPDDAERASFGTWTTIEEAAEYGAIVAQYAEEWATYLASNGCVPNRFCVELQARTARQTILAYHDAYNGHDIDAVMAFFTEESAVTGHRFALEAAGLSAIRSLSIQDMAAARESHAYRISNVEVTGDTVTWDHVWTNSNGTEYCKQGQSAIIRDGTILTWTWPESDTSCD